MSQATILYGGLQVKPNYNTSAGTPSMLTMSEVTITAAQMKTLRANPVELVPAPGPGLVVLFVSAALLLDFGGVAYATPGDMAVKYVSGAGTIASETIPSADGFVASAVDALAVARQKTDLAGSKLNFENKALVLHNVGAAEFTAGNSPLRVKVTYQVVETGW